jgi:hypothetical protein
MNRHMLRHEIDVVSLVSGLLFTGLAVVFALNALDWVSFDIRVVPATVLIVLGIAGISASVVKTSRTTEPELEAEPEPEPASVSAPTGSASGPATEE